MARNKYISKKIVLFLVEGYSDIHALQTILQRIYKNRNIVFEVTKGDVTSDETINTSNVEKKICSVIKGKIAQSKYKRSDVFQVIHLIDTDGVYAPDAVAEKGETNHFFYTPEKITCKKPDRIVKRNNDKRTVLEYLRELAYVGGFPYAVYYMSCNLDHVLYNEQNLDDDKKIAYADAFYESFKGKEEKFIDFLRMEAVNGVPDTSLKDSWEYIKDGLHSLERHTNLHIYFKLHPPYAG